MVRINVYQKAWINSLSLFILLLIITAILTPITSSQTEPPLIIHIYDSNNENEIISNVFFEGRAYDILVSSENETVILGVNISFLGDTYTTSTEEPFITILAPPFDDSKTRIITATKEGYQSTEVYITVMKGQLSVIIDQDIIQEKKVFQITVTDQDNKPVEGASVYFTPKVNLVITDLYGVGYIQAPDVEKTTTANIRVIKSGYFPGSMNFSIENVGGVVFNLTESQLIQILPPTIIAIFMVNIAMFYIIWRKKRISKTPRQTTQIKQSDLHDVFQAYNQGLQLRNNSAIYYLKEKRNIPSLTPQSRIKETRIPTQRKETTILSNEKDTPKDLNELRSIIKVDQPSQEQQQKNEQTAEKTDTPKTSDTQAQKNDDETPVLKKDLEEKKEYLKAFKDFDFRLNENKEKVDTIMEKVNSLSRDVDDLVSLYEIVSDQMNPFVGLSRVTKDRIDALEHYTEEIQELKERLEQLELTAISAKENKDITPRRFENKEKHSPPQKHPHTTSSYDTLKTTDTNYSDQELDTILEESLRTLQPLRNIEQEIIDFLDKIT